MTFLPRPPRPRVLLALIQRDYALTRSYKFTLLLDLLFGVVNLGVYFFISRTFHGGASSALGAAPTYFDFAAVGVTLTVVMEATSSELGARIREEQLTGTLEALVAQPLAPSEMATGVIGFGFFLAMARAAFYLLVAIVFLGLHSSQANWLGFAAVLVASGVALSAIGIVVGAGVLVSKRGTLLASVVPFGMGLLTGAFFPISVLPGWLQAVGKIIPTRFAFDGLRAAIFQGDGWGDDVAALLAFGAVAVPVAVWIFGRALLFARKRGSLGQY